MKKHLGFVFVSAFLFILVAALILVNAISFQGAEAAAAPVFWFGNITINSNGTVSPSNAPVEQTGSMYNLTSDVIGEITVYESNILIGGNGYTVKGNSYEGAPISVPVIPVGFHLYNANNVNVTDIVIENFPKTWIDSSMPWPGAGFYLENSTYNNIYGNTVINNNFGIALDDSSNFNNIYCNNVSANGGNADQNAGIWFDTSSSNNVFNNTLASNQNGIAFIELADNNRIYCNNIIGNSMAGVAMLDSSDSMLYLNNFINNSPNAGVGASYGSAPNVWDNGSVGNYWSDYQTNYPNVTEGSVSGIFGTSYVVGNSNTDYFPLMQPINIVDQFSLPTPVSLPSNLALSALQVPIDNDTVAILPLSGNMTAPQMSNVTLTVSPSENTTTIAFTAAGENGTVGFCNITIPKTIVAYGSIPIVYIDNQIALSQGYTQDANYYYVWFTTNFTVHNVQLVFEAPPPLSPTSAVSTRTSPLLSSSPTENTHTALSATIIEAVSGVTAAIVLGAVLAFYIKRKKKEAPVS